MDERRAQILALALDAFAEKAYDEVSVDEVARAAGISRALVFHYFPSKRDLYVAVIEHAAARLLAETNVGEIHAPEERLRLGLDAYLRYVEGHAAPYLALMRGGIGADPRVEARVEATRAEFLARLRQASPFPVDAPLVRSTLRGWVGFVEASALDWLEHKDTTREALGAHLAAVLLLALRAVPKD